MMSVAWREPLVLWREPWSAFAARVGRRTIIPVAVLVLSGVPGTAWTGIVPPVWLRVPLFVIGLLGVVLWSLAFVNLVLNRRVLLVQMPTGSIERPRSLQERVVKIPQEFVIGSTVVVTVDPPQMASKSEPRITLTAEGKVARVPLFGTSPEDFVVAANAALKGRGTVLNLYIPDDPADEPASDASI